MIEKESEEHPKLSKKVIHQIVVDHLKKHITDLEAPEEEECEEEEKEEPEDFSGKNGMRNKFDAMRKMKNDINAEKAGEND